MYTSVILFALAGSFAPVVPAEPESPRWLDDYSTAWKQGTREKKPLAVVFGAGAEGWDKLSRDGKLGKEAQQILSAHYVCLYIDTATEEGKKLARSFDVHQAVGIVISDRTGEKQAFYHQGDLNSEDLAYYLQRYADPNRVVRTTETNPPERGSVPGYSSSSRPAGGGSAGRSC